MAIDPKHLPEDPKLLQQMVVDLMAQLDGEFTERGKIEALLRELLDAKRYRKSEQLSADQLSLFAAAWQARQAAAEASESSADPMTRTRMPSLAGAKRTARKRSVGGSLCHGTSNASAFCTICRIRKSTAMSASRICGHPPQEIWRDYNRRADMENRIAELKHDLGADGFCLNQFFVTEAAFRAVLLLFNLLAEFQRAAGLPVYRAPATIRTQILTCGAILGAPVAVWCSTSRKIGVA